MLVIIEAGSTSTGWNAHRARCTPATRALDQLTRRHTRWAFFIV